MFTSDVEGLFNLLGGSEQSGTLTLQPEKGNWQARFTLVRGRPTTCVISQATTPPMKLAPEKAIEQLSKQGAFQWELEPPKSEQSLKPVQALPRSALAAPQWDIWDRPCRRKYEPLPTSWERLQRSAFMLIDNQRTVQDIALLLNKRVEDMQQPLQSLYQEGWIGKTT